MRIESKQNPRFKAWKKLLTKKGRKELGQFIIEGEHLVNDALHSGWPIVEVITSEHFECPKTWGERFPVLIQERKVVADKLFAELSETKAPQGVAMVVKKANPRSFEEVIEQCQSLILVDQVQDPGNLGTIIRTTDAAGIGGVLLGKGTADPFSGKALRSTQGSIFHLPVYENELAHIIPTLQERGWLVFGTSLQGAMDYREIKIQEKRKVALLVGNEGEGVDEALLELVDYKIKIPIWGKAESLNVAVATGILAYHIQCQLRK